MSQPTRAITTNTIGGPNLQREPSFRQERPLITLGGDHGVPIPVMRALEGVAQNITLVHVDAHMDWRDESKGEAGEGSAVQSGEPSEMDWINRMVQIGIRGFGSLYEDEINEARAYGSDIITAYEMHDMGIDAVLDRIPDGGPLLPHH